MPDSSSFYFNTAAAGLIPPNYYKVVRRFERALSVNPSLANEKFYDKALGKIRSDAAALFEADEDEVAFVPNFSYALSALVHSLDKSLKVLTLLEDYPSLIDPFRLNGFVVKRFKSRRTLHDNHEDIKVELLAQNIGILAISHVQWLSGFKIDLEEMGAFCQKHGIIFIVDATQSIGAIPVLLHSSQADVIIGSNYKWMNAGFGSGILLASKRFLERHHPKIRGNTSRMLTGGNWTNDASILGYEPGHLNTSGLLLLKQALEDKLHTGIERIAAHNTKLTEQFISLVADTEVPVISQHSALYRSSIIALKGGEPLYNYLTKAGFVVSLRNGAVRLSFHYHNTAEEIDAVIDALMRYPRQN